MAQIWDEQLMWAKYHLSTAKRLFDDFKNYETKRFLSGCLHELALSATGYVNAILLCEHVRNKIAISKKPQKRISQFEGIHNTQSNKGKTEHILKIFEVRRAQKHSPVELLKQDKIILLDNGEYKAITQERIQDLITNLELCIKDFDCLLNN